MAVQFLTDKQVQGLRFNGRRSDIRDAKVPGLTLRVSAGRPIKRDPPPADETPEQRAKRERKEQFEAAQRVVKSWSVQFRIKGQRASQRLTLGTYPAVTIARARERALEAVGAAAEGRDPRAERQAALAIAARQALTFADLVEEYVSRRTNTSSINEIARELRKDAVPDIGHKQPAEVTPADVDKLTQAVVARGSPVMARRLLDNIKALYNFVLLDAPELAERFGITSNPAQRLGRRRRGSVSILSKRPRQRVLDDEEIADWWCALDATAMPPLRRLALKLVLITAQRPGEVRCCRVERLRLEAAPTWLQLEHENKARRRHIVPLSPLAVELFQQAIALGKGEGLIFEDPKRPGDPIGKGVLPGAQSTLFRNHLRELEPATVHDLRRSAATGMRRIGIARMSLRKY